MKTIAIVALYFVFVFLFPVAGAENFPDGADLFIEATRNHAGNHTLIRSLTYVAEQTYRVSTVSEEEIEKEIAEEQARHRRILEKATEDAEFWQNVIDDIPVSLRRHYSQGSIRSRFAIKYKAPSFSRKLMSLQIERQGQNPTKWEVNTNVIESNIVSEQSNSEGVIWNPQIRSAHVNETQSNMEAFLNFGRLQGPSVMLVVAMFLQDADAEKYEFSDINITKFKEEREKQLWSGQAKTLMTVGTVAYDGNAQAYVIESSTTDDKVIERYWIDVNRGYVCPLLQYYDEKGKLLSEYKSENYFLHEKSGLWFPQLYKEMTTNRDGKQEFVEYRIDKSSLDVNFPIADDEFLVEITNGAEVIDTRKGKGSQRYDAIDNGVLSLGQGGLDLDTMDWLVPSSMSPLSSLPLPLWRIILVAVSTVSIVLILLGFYFRFFRKS